MTPRSHHAQIEDDSRQAGVPIVGARYHLRPAHGERACVSANLRHPPRLTHVTTSPCNCGGFTASAFSLSIAAASPLPGCRHSAAYIRRSLDTRLSFPAAWSVERKFVRAVSRPLTFNAAHHVCQDKSDVPHCHYRTPFSSFGCYVPRLSDGAITGEQEPIASGARSV